jgi:hypothetical protein
MKSVFAVLVMAAVVGVVPQAHAAAKVKVLISGSSAMWQATVLAAYNSGNCPTGGTAPCFHYTANNFNLTDTRPTTKGGAAVTDPGAIWIVWDSSAGPNVWGYIKVDSIVGDRCYFAQPHCNVNIASFPSPGNLIVSKLYGDNSADTMPPTSVQTLFTAGAKVNTAATDIRPEDAAFNQCRSNSALGGGPDGLAGLGYGVNASGACPSFGADLAHLLGTPIKSGYPGSSATANNLAFNISGTDPFTNRAIPSYTTLSVGASPIIFIINRQGALAGVTNATESQLQTAFSGTTCTGNVFAGGTGGNIDVYLREPLSGTMNTTEYTVFRYPDQGASGGKSQETGVNAANPLAAAPCGSGGSRFHSIGTGEEVKFVQNSNANFGVDGIGYTFFSYGNVSSIANNPNYAYLQLNGIDPIFHKYGSGIDPGQPATAGVLPNASTLPAACANDFPCSEDKIWSGHLSFPNLRNGSYRSWSVVRLVSNGSALTNVKALVDGAQKYAVTTVPDYVPAIKVGGTPADPGIPLLRSHYTQMGVAPINISATGDKGGDVGGCILTNTGQTKTSDTTTGLGQIFPGNACVVLP